MSQNSRPNNNTPSKWQCVYKYIYIYIPVYIYIYLIYIYICIHIFIKTHSNCWRLGCWHKTSEFPTFQPSHGFRVGSSPLCSQTLPGWNLWPPGIKPMAPKPVGDTPPNKEACSEKISWPSIHFQVPTFVSFWKKKMLIFRSYLFFTERFLYK